MKILVVLTALLVIFPLVFMTMGSFKNSKLVLGPEVLIPYNFTIDNYVILFKAPIFIWLLNSILITSLTVVLSVLINTLAGFTFHHFNFKFKEVLFWLLLTSLLIPSQITLIPMYLMVRNLGLYDTRWGLIMPFVTSSFLIFFYRNFLHNYPSSILDASYVDGAGHLRTYFSIVLPSTTSAISTMCILVFMGTWKMFLLALILVTRQTLWTLTVGITEYVRAISWNAQWIADDRAGGINYGVMMAAGFYTLLPALLMFVLLRKQFVNSLSSTLEK